MTDAPAVGCWLRACTPEAWLTCARKVSRSDRDTPCLQHGTEHQTYNVEASVTSGGCPLVLMQVVLKDEAVEEGFDVEEVAGWTDGYSGSDLKNLCIAAAYFPIRQVAGGVMRVSTCQTS